MKIDNYKKAILFKFYFPILILIIASLIIYSFFVYLKLAWIIQVLAGIFAIVYFILAFKKPHYFFLEMLSSSIIVRFYNPHFFFTKPKTYQISISDFYEYNIKESFWGLRKDLIFKIKKGAKIGEYPPVSISLLTSLEISELKKELDGILKLK